MRKPAQNLNAAIKAHDLDRVKELLREGIRPDAQSCFLSIEKHAHDILSELIKAGADLNALETYWERTPLIKALKVRDEKALELLLKGRANPDLGTSKWDPPLFFAVQEGLVDAVKLLLAAGADIEQRNSSEMTPLIVAARFGRIEVVRMLLEAGANPQNVDVLNRNAYQNAIEEKEEAVARLLEPVSAGKKSPAKAGPDFAIEAINRNDGKTLEQCIASGCDLNQADKLGRRPLIEAIKQDSVELMERCLNAGADAEKVDALDFAVQRSAREIVKLLLRRGLKPKPSETANPLVSACAVRSSELLELLLRAGADPDMVCEPGDDTALMVAARAVSRRNVELLLGHGAKVEAINAAGRTALFDAVAGPSFQSTSVSLAEASKMLWLRVAKPHPNNQDSLEIIKLLLNQGIQVNRRDIEGRTALSYATSPGAAKLLIEAGAQLDIRDKQGREVAQWLDKNGLILGPSGVSIKSSENVADAKAGHRKDAPRSGGGRRR